MNTKEIAIKCLQDEASAILNLIPRIGDNFVKAVELIHSCRGRIIVTGVGKSGHIGAKIAATLASTGTPSFFVNPLDAYHGDLGMFKPEDVVVAISYSGNTDELLRFIPLLINRNIPIIGISGNTDSLLARYSVCHLDISVENEADPLNLAPTASTTATLAMGDALAAALEYVRGFKAEDFAQFHPGGRLGKQLLSKVRDVMVKDGLPIVLPDDKVCDTIIEISDKKMGTAVVLDADGKLMGIVTDGDVRRAMQSKKDKFFALKVRDIMSTSPKTVRDDASLNVAAAIMLKHQIHMLIVVDSERNVVGLIESFTCI